jgi:hypothetical protein
MHFVLSSLQLLLSGQVYRLHLIGWQTNGLIEQSVMDGRHFTQHNFTIPCTALLL